MFEHLSIWTYMNMYGEKRLGKYIHMESVNFGVVELWVFFYTSNFQDIL